MRTLVVFISTVPRWGDLDSGYVIQNPPDGGNPFWLRFEISKKDPRYALEIADQSCRENEAVLNTFEL